MNKLKLCGCKESCFENGDDIWGHLGGIMCKHLSERNQDCTNIIVDCCIKDNIEVQSYFTQNEYNTIIENLHNTII